MEMTKTKMWVHLKIAIIEILMLIWSSIANIYEQKIIDEFSSCVPQWLRAVKLSNYLITLFFHRLF